MTQFESDRKNKNSAPDEPATLTVDSIATPKSPTATTTTVADSSTSAPVTSGDKTKPVAEAAPDTYSSTLREQEYHASMRWTDELVSKPTKKKDEEIAAAQSSVARTAADGVTTSEAKAPVIEKALLRSATTLQDQEAIINKLLQPAGSSDKSDKKVAVENIEKVRSIDLNGTGKALPEVNSLPINAKVTEKSISPAPVEKVIDKTFTPNIVVDKLDASFSKPVPGKLDAPVYKNETVIGRSTLGTMADQISSEAQGLKREGKGLAATRAESEFIGGNDNGILKSVIEEKSKSISSPAYDGSRYKLEPIADGNTAISKGFRTEPNILKNDGGYGRPENFTGGSVDLSAGKSVGLPKAFVESSKSVVETDPAAIKAAKYGMLENAELGKKPGFDIGVQAKSTSFDANVRQLDHQIAEPFNKPNVVYPKQFEPNAPSFKDPIIKEQVYKDQLAAKLEAFKSNSPSAESVRGQDISAAGKLISEGYTSKYDMIKQYPAETKPFPVEGLSQKLLEKDWKSGTSISESGGAINSMPGGAKLFEQAGSAKLIESINGNQDFRVKPNDVGSLKQQINMVQTGGNDFNAAERGALINKGGAVLDDRINSKLGELTKADYKSMIADGKYQSNFDTNPKADLKQFAAPAGKLGQDMLDRAQQKVFDKTLPATGGAGSITEKLAGMDGGMKTMPALPQDLKTSILGKNEQVRAGELSGGNTIGPNPKLDGKLIDAVGRNPNNTITPAENIKQTTPLDAANRGASAADSAIRPGDRTPAAVLDAAGKVPATSPPDVRTPASDSIKPGGPADTSFKPGPADTFRPGPADTIVRPGAATSPEVKPGSTAAAEVKPGPSNTGEVKPGTTVVKPETAQPGTVAPGARPAETLRSPVPNATSNDAAGRPRTTESGAPITEVKPGTPGKEGTIGRPVQDAGTRPSDAAAGKIPTTASPIKLATALDPVSAFEQSSQRIRQLAENRAGDSVAVRNPFESRNPFETKLSGLIAKDFGTESSGTRGLDGGKNVVRSDVDGRHVPVDGVRGNAGTIRSTGFGPAEAGRRIADGVTASAGREQQLTSFEPQGKHTAAVRGDQAGKELPGKIDISATGVAAGIGRIPLSGSVRVADFQPGREVGQSPLGTGADVRAVGDIARIPGMRGFGQVGDGRTAAVQGDIRAPRGETNRYITGLELALILSIAGIAKLRGDARSAGARLEGRTWSITRQNGRPLIYVDGRQNPFQVQKSFGKGDGSFRIMVSAKGDQAAKLSTRTMRTAEISSKSQTTDAGRGLNLGLVSRLTYLNSLGKTGPMNYYGQFKSTSYTGGMGLAFVMAASGMTRGSMMPNEIQAGDRLNPNMSGPADRVKSIQQNSLITQFGRFNLDAAAGNSAADTRNIRKDDDVEDASQTALDDYQDFLARLDGFSKREDEEDDESVIVNRAIRFGTEALFEEGAAEDEEVVTEVDEDDTKNGALSQVLRRPKWVIEAGQTLDGIAERLFGNADLGWLIADLNASLLRETYIDNKRIVELHSRQEIELPVYQDIQKFNQARKKTWNAENLITIVVERQIDREAVENVLRKVVGAEA